ncbi:hypothetical protein [Gimesia maris]|uniref:hypothetical protein n=2 Tax=Gimesia maris TaxID=122 RepID=UPI00241EC70B|nr:hypothetical protein [Gimesia maris]|tara:strand:+ start:109410 stop:109796 length:387 start_codon:yes stop_codon:yes gene_type:complete
MVMIKKWLAHAFAVERPEDFAPTVEQQQIADRICREIIRRDMVTLAILTLETCRPLNYIGSQAIHFFTPLLSILVDPKSQKIFADLLEQRASIEWLCQRLEFLSNAKQENQNPPVDHVPVPVLKNDDS